MPIISSTKRIISLVLLLLVAVVVVVVLSASDVVFAKKTIHLLTHTHDDVGWLKNPYQYLYGLNNTIQNAHVNAVIDSVVAGLAADENRKFTYVEMFFFHGWWQQQGPSIRKTVRKLVAEGRLQFACGGWTMPDEASPLYVEFIDIYTLGHRFIERELGGTVKTFWQLDPFGHSATHTVIGADAGMDGVYFARMTYAEYKWRAENKGRQFWWRPSKTRPNVGLFAEVLPDSTYCTPNGISWDIDDELGSCFQHSQCDGHQFIVDNKNMAQYNADMYVNRTVALAQHMGNMTLGDDLLFMSGCDFQWSAGLWNFANNDKLIDIMNKDGRYEMRYSTPHEYTQARIKSGLHFPTRDGDIFPYDDGFNSVKGHNWWSGYFTSRPALKRYARQLSRFFTVSRQLRGLFGAPADEFSHLARALGIISHHDATAGTSKQHVANWYAKDLHQGYTLDARELSASAPAAWSGVTGLGHCPRLNESECEFTAQLAAGGVVNVLIWNSDAHTRDVWVEIPVPTENITIAGRAFPAAVFAAPESTNNYGPNPKSQPYTLAFHARQVPAAGFSVVQIKPASQAHGKKKKQQRAAAGGFFRHEHAHAKNLGRTAYNENFILSFAPDGGLASMQDLATGKTMSLQQDYCYIKSNIGDSTCSQAGGAYVMRPVANATCQPLTIVSSTVIVDDPAGYYVRETDFGWASQRITVAAGEKSFSLTFTVREVSIADNWGKEFMMRIRTNISSNGEWHTDSSGREFMHRRRNFRHYPPPPADQQLNEPIAQNIVPVNSLIYLNDSSLRFAITTDVTVGGGSIHDGEIWLDVHRRLVVDDGRGVGEPLNETEFVEPYVNCDVINCGAHYGAPLRVRGTFRFSLEDNSASFRNIRAEMDRAYFHPEPFFVLGGASHVQNAVQKSILSADLPDQLQLTTFQMLDAKTILLRLGHKYAVNEGATETQPVTVQLRGLLNDKVFGPISSIERRSLTLLHKHEQDVISATISPMEIQTFLIFLV